MHHSRWDSMRRVAGVCALALLALLVAGQPAQLLAAPDKPAPTLSSPLDINKASADELTAQSSTAPHVRESYAPRQRGPWRPPRTGGPSVNGPG